ncbi:Asp-tRNA(Asn)/Glu-tRNA(Gln) amidotransferase GatCAB subunit C [Candidatus Berkelbacteria bacterium CG_4_8_14_3_um_filter_33_6]|uniref:Asp-tRNA(Asn)/Glu-tRNA(Gln) amidotransferase GatCAB subunit C n=1 Tax=Candidatus Berkelbacteria bacterium CG_4_10_14_0_2_um_filter_35_9_33_12 TaxID=1974499 RepID=A0A2M7W4D0_9BACT|nr:MAG: Asp-tRNA(Asn)/Glu-tRNA(Gln) amidotransferase GatCAB subunit C [Candidatus Berkelbacteria bacterium CG23_combo_of_CG06-09_8_20_14_all_33_15]PIS08580.1 MAG: Asp-tRNA(Asn)/Glu-tRNA(Gln) amidotransferase GatCAB subunit C [Candidatus Berkelbacteria bacterium CG10_big_fil_rev_8_21_14_0_10_33_10]PIX31209.1 MAG: Asp-tRNA(Asn)/Glu-tRNA(Gln) amidotransferase GatCAB subunit C [Candidatus Berkelbacteria bacterium CG_4_8_14_3_um_filter_33_6]PIZ28207.1 MAG: Asp-tRNA(Asn)/Glu-tRNA(Gln) amidotransferase
MKNKIDLETIKKISRLSGLEIAENDQEKYLKQFSEILDYFSVLDKIDEKSSSFDNHIVTKLKDVTRKDEVSDSLLEKKVFLNHKNSQDKYFKVERILYNEDN